MLNEVLRNQAEHRQLLARPMPRVGNDLPNLDGLTMRFPISTLHDFVRFNDDLRNDDYANNVVKK